MATTRVNEEEDFVTCGVCMNEFDAENRKPKFLQCSHTVCLSCVKEICRNRFDNSITCPFCRGTTNQYDFTKLPNNPYALHMMKSLKEKKTEMAATSTPLEGNWCLTCGLAEKDSCAQSGHSFINMEENAIRDFEARLITLKELLALKDRGTNKLAMAIQKRKQIQEQLSLVLNSIKAAENELTKRQNENNLRLTEMVSILERKSASAVQTKPCYQQQQNEKTGLPFSKLMILVDDASPDDTAEEMKLKMTKAVERYEQMFNEATVVESEYDFFRKTKVSVLLRDENDLKIPTTCNWLESGFSLNPVVCPGLGLLGPELKQDLMLISYAIFLLLKRQNVTLQSQHKPTNDAPSSNVSVTKNILTGGYSLSSSRSNFALDQNQPISNFNLFSTTPIVFESKKVETLTGSAKHNLGGKKPTAASSAFELISSPSAPMFDGIQSIANKPGATSNTSIFSFGTTATKEPVTTKSSAVQSTAPALFGFTGAPTLTTMFGLPLNPSTTSASTFATTTSTSTAITPSTSLSFSFAPSSSASTSFTAFGSPAASSCEDAFAMLFGERSPKQLLRVKKK